MAFQKYEHYLGLNLNFRSEIINHVSDSQTLSLRSQSHVVQCCYYQCKSWIPNSWATDALSGNTAPRRRHELASGCDPELWVDCMPPAPTDNGTSTLLSVPVQCPQAPPDHSRAPDHSYYYESIRSSGGYEKRRYLLSCYFWRWKLHHREVVDVLKMLAIFFIILTVLYLAEPVRGPTCWLNHWLITILGHLLTEKYSHSNEKVLVSAEGGDKKEMSR